MAWKVFIFLLIITITTATPTTDSPRKRHPHTQFTEDNKLHKHHTLSDNYRARPTLEPHGQNENKNRFPSIHFPGSYNEANNQLPPTLQNQLWQQRNFLSGNRPPFANTLQNSRRKIIQNK